MWLAALSLQSAFSEQLKRTNPIFENDFRGVNTKLDFIAHIAKYPAALSKVKKTGRKKKSDTIKKTKKKQVKAQQEQTVLILGILKPCQEMYLNNNEK